jgi:hypothetical protein
MTIAAPVRIDRLQTALYTELSAALGGAEVYWAYTAPTHEQLPASYVVLTTVAGPAPFNRAISQGTLENPATSIEIAVTSATVGATYTIELNAYPYSTVGIGGDTVTTIRDRLISAVNADAVEPVTASIFDANELTLTADFNGALVSLELFGPLSASAPVVSDTSVLVHDSEQTMLVNIQAYSKNREPWNGAESMTTVCYAALRSQSVVDALARSGIVIWTKGVPTSIPVVIGSRWESRSSFDVTFAMRSVWAENVERIETVIVEGLVSQTISP